MEMLEKSRCSEFDSGAFACDGAGEWFASVQFPRGRDLLRDTRLILAQALSTSLGAKEKENRVWRGGSHLPTHTYLDLTILRRYMRGQSCRGFLQFLLHFRSD